MKAKKKMITMVMKMKVETEMMMKVMRMYDVRCGIMMVEVDELKGRRRRIRVGGGGES